MANLSESQVIKLLRDEYRQRLIETIDEAEMFDDKGNNLLSPGLKVKHKDSGLEYTVDSTEGEKDSGNVKVRLKLPDEPRFEPPQPDGMISDNVPTSPVIGETDSGNISISTPAGDYELTGPGVSVHADEEETEFVIDQEEFEKEYEVT